VSGRGRHLLGKATQQIDTLAATLAGAGESALPRPCPGRDKLGDGTVGAVAMHTTENYKRIAGFLTGTAGPGTGHHAGEHAADYRAEDLDFEELLDRLSAAKDAFAVLGELDDAALDTVPAAGDVRFADGKRTLEQIVESMLKHQRHQVDAIRGALA
jgi:hypothetical protein